jgi:hypothetical protein
MTNRAATLRERARQALDQFRDDRPYTWDLDKMADAVAVAVLEALLADMPTHPTAGVRWCMDYIERQRARLADPLTR